MTETPYNRYKRVLAEIAAGTDDPQALALEALRSRRVAAAPKELRPKQEREYWIDRAKRNYLEWIDAGKPKYSIWAKTTGLAATTTAHWINLGKKRIEEEEYLKSDEHKKWCDEQIAWAGWEHFKEVWRGSYAEQYEQLWGVPDGIKPIDQTRDLRSP